MTALGWIALGVALTLAAQALGRWLLRGWWP